MTAIFILLAVVLYVAFLVQWKDLGDVFGKGAWATIGVYVVLAILIVYVVACPESASVAPAVHH